MVERRVVVRNGSAAMGAAFDALRDELHVPLAFPDAVLADAEQAVADGPSGAHADRTEIPFITIDPAGSMDLDQAMAVSRTAQGFVVQYAIADVSAWVRPGSPTDAESWARGETLYFPDKRIPLYPPAIGEKAGSLLPDGPRPAVLWTLTLDGDAELRATTVQRAMVRSRAKLNYVELQAALDAGKADEWVHVLADIGAKRIALQAARGGADMRVPEQQVDVGDDGRVSLSYRAGLPLEDWNAQISQLTGIAAAALMLHGGVGLLRTLPPPDERAVAYFRRTADALHVPWPQGTDFRHILATLDPHDPHQAALLNHAPPLFRGSGYAAFDGAPPALTDHAGVAAAYAHATAPLRRLADRYVLDLCVALCAGDPVPAYVRDALPKLPAAMAGGAQRGHAAERAVIDLVETRVLASHIGEVFDAVVVDVDDHGSVIQLADPAVRARMAGSLALGGKVRVRLTATDETTRRVTFVPA